MSTIPKPFLYGLLLLAGVLTGFTCWGIVSLVADLRPLIIQANTTLASIDGAAQGLITTESQLNAQIQQDAPKVARILDNASKASANLVKFSAGLNRAITEINRPCGAGHPCGTIAELNEAIRALHHAIGQIEIAANHEDKNLSSFDTQELVLYQNATTNLSKLGDALGRFSSLEDAVQTLVNNKDLKTSLANVSAFSKSLAGMGKETAQAVHDFFHPTWLHRIIAGVEEVTVDAGKIFLP